jgi:hypothetical protein
VVVTTVKTTMESALKHQTEELNQSRSDYSALFQNFKQSRILFEEREYASKAYAQRVQNESNANAQQICNENSGITILSFDSFFNRRR